MRAFKVARTDSKMSMIRFPKFDPFEVTIAMLGAAFFVGLSLAL